jgi:hypothetical protein
MAYDKFRRTGARVDSPAFSIVNDGRIALNSAAARILSDAGIGKVVLLWDADNQKMAMKAAAKGDKDAFSVSIATNKHSASMRAKMFIVGLVGWTAERETVPATWDPKEKMFEAELSRFLTGNHKKPSKHQTKPLTEPEN